MTRPRYIASCSGGKDSVATILLAAEKNEPLDEVIYSEVMFDQEISGEVPEHRDFIHQKLKPFVENELGCKFTVLRSDKTYDDVFHHIITRGPYEGLLRGFVWPGKCAVNRDCKMPPLRKYHKAQPDDTRSYVGIALDEPKRLARLNKEKDISLLAKYGMTEADAWRLCEKYDMLSPCYQYSKRFCSSVIRRIVCTSAIVIWWTRLITLLQYGTANRVAQGKPYSMRNSRVSRCVSSIP